ncbi:glycosyltransferase [Polaribacter pectinis]|uniref:Glycosyltransferase n=2 Tax=Polaribacter pectinis TaxID=2738844 RepID=A0A7G9LEJ9_9FLAO|nr:glycosyltransferase [Polaribacter pectinis]
MMKTCIIIPCYNEEKRLPTKTFLKFIQNKDIHFCFVNDGSSDNTIDVLNSIKIKEPDKVLVINNNKNVGKAEAIREAVLELYNLKLYDYIGFFDADLATPLFEIENLRNYFIINDSLILVMGSRIKRMGANVNRKFHRFLFGRIFATIISANVLKLPVYDTQCGAKLFSTKIPVAVFNDKFITKWLFDVELIIRIKKLFGNDIIEKIVEYPLLEWVEKGESKVKFTDFLNTPKEILKIKRKYK